MYYTVIKLLHHNVSSHCQQHRSVYINRPNCAHFLGIPLYDGTGIFVDKELIAILDHYGVQLGNLVNVFQTLSSAAPTTEQGKGNRSSIKGAILVVIVSHHHS